MRTVIQNFFLSLILIGCNEQSNEPASLTPYEQWRSFNLHNYTIEQVRVCYCATGGERVSVTVMADTVFSARKLSDSTIIPYPASKLYLSIDSLFGIIRYPKGDSLVIVYNAYYGFPEKLDINPQQHPVDGGVLFETSNIHPIH